MRQFFRKSERLCNKKQIAQLFNKGDTFFIFPFRVVFLKQDLFSGAEVRILFLVGKRLFKTAVQRNRIRRRMRECWRKSKSLYFKASENNKSMHVAIQYVVTKEESYELLEEKIKLVLQRLQKHHEEVSD
jgi:ribonuclease P protein component